MGLRLTGGLGMGAAASRAGVCISAGGEVASCDRVESKANLRSVGSGGQVLTKGLRPKGLTEIVHSWPLGSRSHQVRVKLQVPLVPPHCRIACGELAKRHIVTNYCDGRKSAHCVEYYSLVPDELQSPLGRRRQGSSHVSCPGLQPRVLVVHLPSRRALLHREREAVGVGRVFGDTKTFGCRCVVLRLQQILETHLFSPVYLGEYGVGDVGAQANC